MSRDKNEPKSPCIGACRLSQGYCLGCKRTPTEIGDWRDMTKEQKEKLLEDIKLR